MLIPAFFQRPRNPVLFQHLLALLQQVSFTYRHLICYLPVLFLYVSLLQYV